MGPWIRKVRRRDIVWNAAVCFGLPLALLILLFFIRLKGRTYEVFPNRGGCRISRDRGRTDWIRELILEVVTTTIAMLGVAFAVITFLRFRRLSRTLKLNLEGLTPSPELLHLFKSIQLFLMFGVSLNIICFFSCVVRLGLYRFGPEDKILLLMFPPLFRLAEDDPEVYHVAPLSLLVLITFIVLLWPRLRKWIKTIRQRINSNPENEPQANPHPFPDNAYKSYDPNYGAHEDQSSSLGRSKTHKNSDPQPAPAKNRDQRHRLENSCTTLKTSNLILNMPLSDIEAGRYYTTFVGKYNTLGRLPSRTSALLRPPAPAKTHAQTSCNILARTKDSWSKSECSQNPTCASQSEQGEPTIRCPASVHRSTLLRVDYSGKLMRQYLELSRRATANSLSPSSSSRPESSRSTSIPGPTAIQQTEHMQKHRQNQKMKQVDRGHDLDTRHGVDQRAHDDFMDISEISLTYDRIIGKLAKVEQRDSSDKAKKPVIRMDTWHQNCSDNNVYDYPGNYNTEDIDVDAYERCEVDTLGSISLHGFESEYQCECDDMKSERGQSNQTILTCDDRSILRRSSVSRISQSQSKKSSPSLSSPVHKTFLDRECTRRSSSRCSHASSQRQFAIPSTMASTSDPTTVTPMLRERRARHSDGCIFHLVSRDASDLFVENEDNDTFERRSLYSSVNRRKLSTELNESSDLLCVINARRLSYNNNNNNSSSSSRIRSRILFKKPEDIIVPWEFDPAYPDSPLMPPPRVGN
ncbi:hypothetical protein BGZ65_007128 [Modicella reniformis]|uniref:Uncharacterized protein n=1 Tax=Modicella reniformis TaxID=1440133 RepID=A0A9P6IRX1_9FUNG|nr:hypothetical protein BGZ65_007128 [Modicella reniformis]